GKSEYSDRLASLTHNHLKHLNIGQLIKNHPGIYDDGYDEEYQSYIVNEDKLCDYLDSILLSKDKDTDNASSTSSSTSNSSSIPSSTGGYIIDYHDGSFLSEQYF